MVAAVAGKRVLAFKVQAFAMGAAVLGLAGAIYAHYNAYVAPDAFQPFITIYMVLALTAGGTGTMRGAVLGAILVVALTEGTRFLGAVLPGLTRCRSPRCARRRSASRSSSPLRPSAGHAARTRPHPKPGARMKTTASWPRIATVLEPMPRPISRCATFRAVDAALAESPGAHPVHHPDPSPQLAKASAITPTCQTLIQWADASQSPTAHGWPPHSGGEPYIGRNAEDIRDSFFDHELIWSLGCESVLNMPVRWNGRTLGTLNLLHRAEWYSEDDIATVQLFAQLALPAVMAISE